MVSELNQQWHKACFTCTDCNKVLDSFVPYNNKVRARRPYPCPSSYPRAYLCTTALLQRVCSQDAGAQEL